MEHRKRAGQEKTQRACLRQADGREVGVAEAVGGQGVLLGQLARHGGWVRLHVLAQEEERRLHTSVGQFGQHLRCHVGGSVVDRQRIHVVFCAGGKVRRRLAWTAVTGTVAARLTRGQVR